MRKLGFGMVALMATALCAPANATNTLTAKQYHQAQAALQAMERTNLIATGNASLSSDVEGKAYIGGNLTGGMTVGSGRTGKAAQSFALARTLTVGGNMTANVNINNGIGLSSIEAVVGGNSTGQITVNNGSVPTKVMTGGSFNNSGYNPNSTKTARYGTTQSNVQTQDKPYVKQDTALRAGGTADLKKAIQTETTALTDQLATLSQVLGALTPTATLISSDRTNIHFSYTSDATTGDYAVADITASQIASGTFKLDSYATAKTLIINVSGATVNFGANMTGNYLSSSQQHIIWNFVNATTISVNTAIYGSVLAPLADLVGSSPINGSVAVKSLGQTLNGQPCDNSVFSGEIHLGTFNGNTHFLVAPPPSGGGSHEQPPGTVPEPASWMTMLAGFGIIGSLIRRQRRRERLAAA